MVPHLLFIKDSRPVAVAIAYPEQRENVHGVWPDADQRTYRVVKVLDAATIAPHDPHEEPLAQWSRTSLEIMKIPLKLE